MLEQQRCGQGKQLGEETGNEHLHQPDFVTAQVGQNPSQPKALLRGITAGADRHRPQIRSEVIDQLLLLDPLDRTCGIEQQQPGAIGFNDQAGIVVFIQDHRRRGEAACLRGPEHHHPPVQPQLVGHVDHLLEAGAALAVGKKLASPAQVVATNRQAVEARQHREYGGMAFGWGRTTHRPISQLPHMVGEAAGRLIQLRGLGQGTSGRFNWN